MQINKKIAVLILGSVSGAQQAYAQDFSYELEAGFGYSDNVTRVADTAENPALDDTMYRVGLSFSLAEQSARLTADIQGSLFYESFGDNYQSLYKNDTVDSETLGTLSGRIDLSLVEDRLSWFVQENYGQQIFNNFQPASPINRENVNYLTTGPQLKLPFGNRMAVTANASWSSVDYEERPIDNQRVGASLGLEREVSSNRSVSFKVDGSRIEYDEELFFAPVERYSAVASMATKAARNDLSVDIGWNRVERAGIEGDGLLANVTWSRKVSQFSTFALDAGSKYSTDGDIFRFNQRFDNYRGETQDVQAIGDPFRNDYVTARWNYKKNRTGVSLAASMQKESYETATEFDRDVFRADISVSRELTPDWSGRIFAGIGSRNYGRVIEDINFDDDDMRFGASLDWHFSRTMFLKLEVVHHQRDGSSAFNDYDENRAFLTIHYRPPTGS